MTIRQLLLRAAQYLMAEWGAYYLKEAFWSSSRKQVTGACARVYKHTHTHTHTQTQKRTKCCITKRVRVVGLRGSFCALCIFPSVLHNTGITFMGSKTDSVKKKKKSCRRRGNGARRREGFRRGYQPFPHHLFFHSFTNVLQVPTLC